MSFFFHGKLSFMTNQIMPGFMLYTTSSGELSGFNPGVSFRKNLSGLTIYDTMMELYSVYNQVCLLFCIL